MTEPEWLSCPEPDRMLDFMLDKASERKFRLFACACIRRHQDVIAAYPWCLAALQAAEGFCDGLLSQAQMKRATDKYDVACEEEEDMDEPADTASTAIWHLMNACKPIAGASWAKSKAAAGCMAGVAEDRAAEKEAQCRLIRCIFPFRPVTLESSRTITQLAHAAYLDRLPGGDLDPSRLAVLADAIEESGAEDDLVGHLRGPGPHWRGCRAVDACLDLQ